jgi:hypothetical protein
LRLFLLAKSLGYESITLVEAARAAGIKEVGSALHDLTAEQLHLLRTYVIEHPERLGVIEVENQRQRLEERDGVGRQNTASTRRKPFDRRVEAIQASISGSASELNDVVCSANNLIHAVSSDMFRGFEHFAVIELGALFETLLFQMDHAIDESGLAESIKRCCESGAVTPGLRRHLLWANRTRNRIVHRRPGRFPTAQEIDEAKHAFAVAVIDIYRRHRRSANLLEPLADSNPEVLNVLDQFFGLDQ